jgi:3-oxoacyl-[acyl-carrier protein] reductase
MSFELNGQNAVITGAARGIGLGISERLAGLGANVSGWDIDIQSLTDNSIFSHSARVDVTDQTSVQQGLTDTIAALGHIDIFINNAGINGPTKPTWEYTLAEWDKVIGVDLTGVFICSRAVIPHMRERRYGRLITVASIAGKEGNPGATAYGAAKAGVIGFAKGLARELAADNITVNCVAPAITETDLFTQMSADYIAEKKAKIPLGRFCSIQEIADTVAWVASPRCSFTTGFVFDVSGGRATY